MMQHFLINVIDYKNLLYLNIFVSADKINTIGRHFDKKQLNLLKL